LAQTEQEKSLAQMRFKVGQQLYDIAKYDKALQEFEKAYRLYPLPGLLFNIARCHELLGNLKQAISNYERFVEKEPESPHAPMVRARVKSLKERLAGGLNKTVPHSEKATGPDKAHTRTWRWSAGWAAVGVGGAAVIAGVVFGALAAGKSADHDETRDSGGVYDDLIDLKQAGERYESAQIGLLVAGGVLAALGGGFLVWELMGQEDESASAKAEVAPIVSEHSFGLAGRVEF